MAIRFAIATGNWLTRAVWSDSTGGGPIGDDTWPGAGVGDTAIFDAASGNITVTQSNFTFPLAELDQENFTGTLVVGAGFETDIAKLGGTYEGGNSILCTGDITLFTESASNWVAHSGSIIAGQASGTPTLLRGTSGDKVIGNFRIDNAGVTSFQQMGEWTLTAKTFVMVAGKFDTGNNNMNVAGDINASAGTFIVGGILTLTANGPVEMSFGNRVTEFSVDTVATVTINSGKKLWTSKISGAGGIVGAGELVIEAGAAGFWAITGDVDVATRVIDTSNAPGMDINISGNKSLTIETTSTRSITMDANVNIGAGMFLIQGTGNDDLMTIDFDTFNITCGEFKQGRNAAATGSADIDLGSGTHTIASWVVGNALNNANVLKFNKCNLNLSGTFDGNADGTFPILATNIDAAIHGGTIEQLTITDNLLNAVNGVTDAGGSPGNTLVAFEGNDNFPPAGTLLLLGAGT